MLASSLFALVLHAEAANVPKIKNIRVRQNTDTTGNVGYRLDTSTDDTNAEISSLTAELTQDDGSVSAVTLTPTNTGLIGSVSLPTLSDTARLTLTTFDASNTELRRFQGFVGTPMSPDDACELDCTIPDLEVLGTEIAGADFAVELMGSATFDVAFATLTVTETVQGEDVCARFDEETQTCREWVPGFTEVSTEYEVGWDTVTTLWSADLTGFGDAAAIKVKAFDEAGNKLETAKTALAQPWDEGHDGVTALRVEEDPLTSVGYFVTEDEIMLSVVSEGWTQATAPLSAEVAWEGGETWTMPATAYQVGTSVFLGSEGDFASEQFEVWVDGVAIEAGIPLAGRGLCEGGTCVSLVEEETGWWLQVTAYAATVGGLPEALTVELAPVYGLVTLEQASFDLVFADEVAVVFGHSFAWAASPLGLDVQAQVKLLGVPKRTGKAPVLAKGKLFGQVGYDQGGDSALSGRDKDAVVARGDILIGGQPAEIERTNPETGETVLGSPPVVLLMPTSNGKGTRKVASTTQTQSTQLL